MLYYYYNNIYIYIYIISIGVAVTQVRSVCIAPNAQVVVCANHEGSHFYKHCLNSNNW